MIKNMDFLHLFVLFVWIVLDVGHAAEICGNLTFQCSTDDCISFRDVCDGQEQCPYGNDERYCRGCPSNWHYWRSYLYFVESEKKEFEDAKLFCEELGGHLTSVFDSDEILFLSYLGYYESRFWLGFTDVEEEGNFKWLDGSNSNFTNWRPGQPNNVPPGEECSEILTSDGGRWNDNRCTSRLSHVCKKPVTGGNEEIQLLLYGKTDIIQDSIKGGCSMPLGMSDHQIPDHHISASSHLDNEYFPYYGRLLNDSYWVPKQSDTSPWIQIQLAQEMLISGVVIDGHLNKDRGWVWVDEFYITYSHNGVIWKPYVYFTEKDKCGQFICHKSTTHDGNEVTIFNSLHACRRTLVMYHQLKALYLRVHPVVASKSEAERLAVGCKLEIIGCVDDDCDYSLGVASGGITNVNITSSSDFDNEHTARTTSLGVIPDVGLQGSGWIPADNDLNPWLRIQLPAVYTIRAISTQGCGDQLAWLTEYCVSTPGEMDDFIFYGDSSLSDCKVFASSNDSISITRNDLVPEIQTNIIYIHPISWFHRPCLRLELIGCASETQRCEIDHVASCDFTRICSYSSGQIASLDYPVPYPQRSTCTWKIITEAGTFILMSFLKFDIISLGDCSSSSVSIYNGGFAVDEEIIGAYCNSGRPPSTIISAFNHLFVVLNTGAEEPGSGFRAEYIQSRLRTTVNATLDTEHGCPKNWTVFKDNCYRLASSRKAINWIAAEDRCQEEDAHLVSIRDSDDMEFIHSVIVGSLGRHIDLPPKVYIGLRLKSNEWLHKWIDERPMSYTDWIAPISEDDWVKRQPDGGRLESCVLIDLDNVHSTNHWHDVPCVSDNNAMQFMCMKASLGGKNTTKAMVDNLEQSVCPENMAECKNGECVHKIFACDLLSGCLSPEQCQSNSINLRTEMIRGNCRPGEFQCLRSGECISISFLCDFATDCLDSSDEEYCAYPKCRSDQFTCSDGQCIDLSKRCDLIPDCVTQSDEELCDTAKDSFQCYDGTWLPAHAQCDGQRDCSGKNWEDESFECDIYQGNSSCTHDRLSCKNGACVRNHHRCVYNKDKYGFLQGCRDATHLENCGSHTCESGLLKCPDSYCIPLRYRCDGQYDCPNGKDEEQCDTFLCPGYYKCRGYQNCLSYSEVCDGIRQCPAGDDELFCGISCPDGCICLGLYFMCTDVEWDRMKASKIPDDVRELQISHVIIPDDTGIIKSINRRLYFDLSRLLLVILIDLSGNGINDIDAATFSYNKNVQILSLSDNEITQIKNSTFANQKLLRYLDISNNLLTLLDVGAFLNLDSLQYLSIMNNDLRGGAEETFTVLSALQTLHSDKYLFCCLVASFQTLTECLPEPDQFSSCEDLIRIPLLRIFMWILGISALLGNLYVITKRFLPEHRTSRTQGVMKVQNIMVAHLAVADSLMGVYMIIIASADAYYRDKYAFFAEEWQSGVLCKMAGLLSILSSEASVFFMTVISVDRFFGCLFPFSVFKLRSKSARIVAAVVWVISLIFSLIPVMIPSYFGDAFYGRSTVCLALPLTTDRPAGWEYSVALFLGINLVSFVIMIACYLAIYYTAKSSSSQAGRDQSEVRAKEIQLALRMAFLVFSDLCCWMPIVFMGILSLTTNVEIPSISYAWIAVFVLPLNSSLNPYLYTIVSERLSRRQAQDQSKKYMSNSKSSSISEGVEHVINKGFKGDNGVELPMKNGVSKINEFYQNMEDHNVLLTLPAADEEELLRLSDVGQDMMKPTFINNLRLDIEMALSYLYDNNLMYEGNLTMEHIFIKKTGDNQAFLKVSNLKATKDVTYAHASTEESLQRLVNSLQNK